MKVGDHFHLTFCSNVFPGETWHEVFQNLRTYIPSIHSRVGPQARFGIGLRLSAAAAQELELETNLDEFRDFLHRENAYVFTINGFPYGAFHGTKVKENVYLPDWTDERRLEYTDRLAAILVRLLSDTPGVEGSISTSPGAYKPHVRTKQDVERMAALMLRHVRTLDDIRNKTGKIISLAIEPEPCCLLETVSETIAFFQDHLFNERRRQGIPEDVVRRHMGVCFDACHMAAEFEDIADAFRAFENAGIRIAKIQISSALRVRFSQRNADVHRLLDPFAEDTYLHQVIARAGQSLIRYPDLPEALAAVVPGRDQEWRVHFHVPLFLRDLGGFESTQDYVVSLLNMLKRHPVCNHLEIETYTWDVLPPVYRDVDTATAIVREINWVLEHLRS